MDFNVFSPLEQKHLFYVNVSVVWVLVFKSSTSKSELYLFDYLQVHLKDASTSSTTTHLLPYPKICPTTSPRQYDRMNGTPYVSLIRPLLFFISFIIHLYELI